MATPAAADQIGKVTAQPVSCASVMGGGGVPNGNCFLATVSCPSIADIQVPVKVNQPAGGNSIGTVLFTVGGGGLPWYDVHFKFGVTAIEDVLAAGYTTVQFDYDMLPQGFMRNQVFAGWLTGPGGPRTLACRWASMAQWAHDNVLQPNTPYCATSNSAGAGATAFALAFYGLGSMFNMIEETSGPPFTRIDNGCLCNSSFLQTPCGRGALSECYLQDATAFLDPSYNNRSCSMAERTHHSPFESQFVHDSLDSVGATFNFPATDIHLVFGGQDASSSVPQGVMWQSLITDKNGAPTVACVADAPHELADVLDGATKIADDLIASCH
jgi:hypothetical protein